MRADKIICLTISFVLFTGLAVWGAVGHHDIMSLLRHLAIVYGVIGAIAALLSLIVTIEVDLADNHRRDDQ